MARGRKGMGSVRLLLASDIHGANDDLVAALQGAEQAVLLGDFINIIDYNDLSGILAEFVDRETIVETLQLIREKRVGEAKARMVQAAGSVDDLPGKVGERASECYRDLFSRLPCPCLVIHGNVDFPKQLKAHLNDRTRYIERVHAFDAGGARVGIVCGSPSMNFSFGMPGEVTPEEYGARLAELGPVDHLLVHCPPALKI
ncbi:MAG: hypothetical protein M5R36_14895 [Deltaproteobacteria bacterium]|nr:hypothetical protein [Deltaproteobacteria bacterium]